ncbi:MAG: phosphoglycerate kinase [Tissierellia bacterium]|nr:phosphoglycerate kinase [Tissierellia bacterium]
MKIENLDLRGKRVLVRVDFNVPVEGGQVKDNRRIKGAKPTLDLLLNQGARVVLISHRGRPKGQYKEEFSMGPVLEETEKVLGRKVQAFFSPQVVNDQIIAQAQALEDGQVALLENLRFRPEEEANDPDFAKDLAKLGDIFINDAFGTAHRSHASNVGVAQYLPSYLGLLVGREVSVLSELLDRADKPYLTILGGSKVSDKIGIIENLLDKVDGIMIVGAMANTFLEAQGYAMGRSLVEKDKIDLAKDLLDRAKKAQVQVFLPRDLVVAEDLEAKEGQVVAIEAMDPDRMALDIGPKTLEAAKVFLAPAKTVMWNGPAGVFEKEAFSQGTMGLAKILSQLDAKTVVGGGDSAAAVAQSGLEDSFYHISSGGGASLEFLEGNKLPALAAILGEEA